MRGYFLTTYDMGLLTELLKEIEESPRNEDAVDEIRQVLEDAYPTELDVNECDD